MLQNLANTVMRTDEAQANRLMLRALELRKQAYGEDNPAPRRSAIAPRPTRSTPCGGSTRLSSHYERAMALHQADGHGEHAGSAAGARQQ